MKIFLLFVLCLAALSLEANEREVPKSLKDKMQSFAKEMNTLLPLAFSRKTLSDNEANKIKKSVTEMLEAMKELDGHFSPGDSRTPFMTNILRQQLSELKESVEDRSYDYAKSITKSIPKACIACHMQDRTEVPHFIKLSASKFDDLLSYADYQEMIRDFSGAEKTLYAVILDTKSSIEIKNQALTQILTLEIRVLNDPKETIKKFSALETSIKEPLLKSRLEKINAELFTYNKRKEFSYLDLTDKNIEAKAKEFETKFENIDSFLLNETDLVNALVFLSNIYDYTNNVVEQKELPVALYWISIIEKKLQLSLFYSLSDLYLRKCIKDHSKHSYAKKCFATYKQNTIDSFTGTRGTDLPASVKKDLDRLQALVK